MRIRLPRPLGLILVLAALLTTFTPAGEARSTHRETTGAGYTYTIGVRLGATSVNFAKARVPRGAQVRFSIVNVSAEPRRFTLGGRETKLLEPHKLDIFLLGFESRGTYTWKSWMPGAAASHTQRGSFRVF